MKKFYTRTMLIGGLVAGGAWAWGADPTAPAAKPEAMPEVPAGVTAKVLNDEKDEQGVLAKAANAAMTKGGFDDLIERLSTPDRNRIGDFVKRDFAELDGRVDQIRKNWKTKYGSDFDASAAMFDGFLKIKEGEITNPTEVSRHWPVSPVMTADGAKTVASNAPESVKYLDQGRNVAVVMFPASHGLPGTTVSMIHEAVDDWRIDVPDNLSGQQIYDNLKTALTSFGDNVAAWPADQTEAYRNIGHRVVMSVYGLPVTAEARTASERMAPAGK